LNKNEVERRAKVNLDKLEIWAQERGLKFSSDKSNAMVFKGNFDEGLNNGNLDIKTNIGTIILKDKIKYLGVMLDRNRKFNERLKYIADKCEELYSRLRRITSADWGMIQATSGVIYKAVFIPRIMYASEIWGMAVKSKRAIKLLGQKQREPLLSLTGAYKTVSTDALQVVAGQLPLDLEIIWDITKKNLRKRNITEMEAQIQLDSILDEWQERWNRFIKGRWTYQMIPYVRERLKKPMKLDYYVVQFLTGHGDKLRSFRLVSEARCECGNKTETVDHVHFHCETFKTERSSLKETLRTSTDDWPCDTSIFLKTAKHYNALANFAKRVLRTKKGLP